MLHFRRPSIFFIAIFASVLPTGSAFAWTSSWLAGAHTTSGHGTENYKSIGPKVGIELTWGKPYDLELGLASDGSIVPLKSGSSQSGLIIFIGGIARKHFLQTDPNVFADATLGISPRLGRLKNETGIAVGTGVGYKFPLSGLTSLSPRLGYRLYGIGGGIQHSFDVSVTFSLLN